MVTIDRNVINAEPWILQKIEDNSLCADFDCGDSDLNEYFQVDAPQHREELLTQSYCLKNVSCPDLAIALSDFCNDTVSLKKLDKQVVDQLPITYKFLPAVKLTRIGVNKEYQGKNIGSHLINLLKILFVTDNRTGCRFITVDAYNRPEVVKFYQKNDFRFLTDRDKVRETRSMYYDLKRLELPIQST